jgi:hypothetical protein
VQNCVRRPRRPGFPVAGPVSQPRSCGHGHGHGASVCARICRLEPLRRRAWQAPLHASMCTGEDSVDYAALAACLRVPRASLLQPDRIRSGDHAGTLSIHIHVGDPAAGPLERKEKGCTVTISRSRGRCGGGSVCRCGVFCGRCGRTTQRGGAVGFSFRFFFCRCSPPRPRAACCGETFRRAVCREVSHGFVSIVRNEQDCTYM